MADPFGRTSRARVALLLALSLAACRHPASDDGDPDACQQTYEFGNLGCAEVRGQVLGSGGTPLAGVSVGPVYPAGTGGYNSPVVDTDPEGRFSFRIHRFAGDVAPTSPDTFSIYVRAAVRPPPVVGVPSPARDSALVRLTLAPVGRIPTPATVDFRLSYP